MLPASHSLPYFSFTCRDYAYSTPENEMANDTLNGYCVQTSCYRNIISNNTFNSSLCNPTYCEVETPVPTIPDIDNLHWFFDYALYIGGGIHLLISLAMLISYFLVNAVHFVLPDFIVDFLIKAAQFSLPNFVYCYLYVKFEYMYVGVSYCQS